MRYIPVLLFLLLTAACSQPIRPLPVKDSGLFTFVPFAETTDTGLLALSREGHFVAWSDNGLTLLDVATGNQRKLLANAADALCWSPDGQRLAAVVRSAEGSHLYVFHPSTGKAIERALPGRVRRLQWSETGLLIAGTLRSRKYTFGTQVEGILITWDERWREERQTLFETTLTPATAARLGNHLYRSFDFDLSPLQDEILYTRIQAPPAFSAARQLILRNLQTDAEKILTRLPLQSGGGRLTADGETLMLDDGLGQIRQQDIWSGVILHSWPGTLRGYEPRTGLLWTDQALYQKQDLLVNLPQISRVAVSTGGSSLVVAWRKGLYRLSGDPLQHAPDIAAEKIKKLQKLRRLRSRGLIEVREYRQARERLLK